MAKEREDEPICMSHFTPMSFDGARLWVPCRLDGRKRNIWLSADNAMQAISYAYPLVANASNIVSFVAHALKRGDEKRGHG